MRLHLLDGTYELFRAYHGAPRVQAPDGREVGAALGLARSLLSLIRTDAATHVAVAFDHVVESFRNDLFAGYKTSEGIDPDLLGQFALAERVAHVLGMVVWPMVEFEADDAMATGAARYSALPHVSQILLCTPDKDLAQSVRGTRVVHFDRRRRRIVDEDGVRQRFGVGPASIPDWLALVGDSADGIPGIPRWGARSASAALAAYHHVDQIPDDPAAWVCHVRGAPALAESLASHRRELALYRTLATLRVDVPIEESVEDLEWLGARRESLEALAVELGADGLVDGVPRWRDDRT